MIYVLNLILFTLTFFSFGQDSDLPTVSDVLKNDISGQYKMAPMKLLLSIVGQEDNDLENIIKALGKCLSLTSQFDVSIEKIDGIKNKKEILDLFNRGYSLIIFFNHTEDKKAIEWRLYDAADGVMLKGFKMHKRGSLHRGYAYNLADDIWPELTKQQSSFSSKISFIKKRENISGKQNSVISVCDIDGSNQVEFIDTPGTYLGLYWDLSPDKHRFFCSEFTRYNVRLVSFGVNKNKKIIFNFKGTCVGISLSNDYNRAIYCRSGDIWEFKYDEKQKNGIHKRLISNGGKNIYPILLDNGDIIFCSDSRKITKSSKRSSDPQICYYNNTDKNISLITNDGYCISPAYSKTNNKIVYSKKINGYFQIFVYDLINKNHQQVTFDNTNKIDSCWSPCGNFIVFCCQYSKFSRIAIYNLKLRRIYYLTNEKDYCICPSWSQLYKIFPSLI